VRLALPVVLIALLASPALADEAEDAFASALTEDRFAPSGALSGDFQNRTTVDFVADDEFEDFFSTRELLYAKGVFSLRPKVSLTLSGIGEYRLGVNRAGTANTSAFRGDLEELYADVHLGRFDLRLGQQIVTWGKTDVFAPTDTINTQDLRYVFDTELGHVKIGNLMAKADCYAGAVSVEAIFLPFFRPHRADFIGGDWSLLGTGLSVEPLIAAIGGDPVGRLVTDALDHYFPRWDDELEETLNERANALFPEAPQDDFTHWQAAAKLDYHAGRVDGSVSYFYAVDPLPTVYLHPRLRSVLGNLLAGGIDNIDLDDLDLDLSAVADALTGVSPGDLVKMRFERNHQFGADLAVNLGPSVFRAEGKAVVDRHLYTTSLAPVPRTTVTYVASLDYTFPASVIANVEFLHIWTPTHTDALLTPRDLCFLIFYLHGSAIEDRLEYYAQLLYNVSRWSARGWRKGEIFGEDFQVSAKASYKVRQDLELGLGTIFFGGPRDQLLAVAHPRSFAFLDLKYSF
jgi:hypothetical protein